MRISDWSSDVCSSDLGRFAGVLQESGNVADGLVELRLALRARLCDLEALDGRLAAGRVDLAVDRALQPLHFPQRVGHRYVGEQRVVPAQRARLVLVEGREVGEIGSASCRDSVGQYV